MAKGPGYTAVLVITLALGIGASTTIFSVVNSVLLEPLPYKDPDRLVRVYTEFLGRMNLKKFWVSPPEFNELNRDCRSCEAVGAVQRGTASLAGGDRPVRVPAGYATHELLPMLGVPPLLGRFFDASEDVPGDPTVVMLGHDVWKRSFGGDPEIVGRKIMLNAMPVTVVGVMPAGFDYPGGVDAWVPKRIAPNADNWGSHGLEVTARLKPGVSVEALRAEITSLSVGWSAGKDPDNDHTFDNEHHLMTVAPLQEEVVGSLATTLWLLQGAVLFVLLIAIANVTNLLLARAEARSREVAVRHALGATRARLIRQFVTESLLLGLIGGGLGVLVAVWALDATISLIPKSAPRVHEIAMDQTALLFALVLTIASSLVFGLAPILHTRRADVAGALKDGGPRTSGSATRLRVRRFLVIAEIALAVVLVIGCGMMVKSFVRLQQVDVGFKPDHLLTFEVELPRKAYPEATQVNEFWRRAIERLRALPGVESAALISGLPPNRPRIANDLGLPGRTRAEGDDPWNTDHWQVISDGAIETMGMKLLAGRTITADDVAQTPKVVLVNETFAKKFFPGEDPIGQLVQFAPWLDGNAPTQTVVGLIADYKQNGVDKPVTSEMFIPLFQGPGIDADLLERSMIVVIRTSGPPDDMLPSAQRVIQSLDPSLPVAEVKTMDDVLWEAVARPRFLTFLLGAFAVLALVLAAIGIYGVMAYTVAQRTHEIGIRVALGARPAQVRAMVLRQAAGLVGIGVTIGLAGAFVLEQLLHEKLAGAVYGERLRDPLTFLAVGVVVVFAAMLATWLPARRATRVEPTVALRAE
jgi:putative ABC transport system permease protein